MKPLTNIKRITICEQSVARLYIESIRKHLSPNPVKEINELSEINSHLTGYVVIDVTRFVIAGFTAQEIIRLVSRTNAIIYCIWPMQMQPDEIPYDVPSSYIVSLCPITVVLPSIDGPFTEVTYRKDSSDFSVWRYLYIENYGNGEFLDQIGEESFHGNDDTVLTLGCDKEHLQGFGIDPTQFRDIGW